ncbi:MAG: PHP domain-containing protein [Clostridia bacterium]|nr:PHP domain-containing protein [Clostridia bacterium]
MKLKIDFHVHSQKSFDCDMTISQIIDIAKEKGLDGICICDHANTDIQDSLSNDNVNFIIIPAVEFTTGKNHIISMFLEKEPDIVFGKNFMVPVEKIAEETEKCGGICILAHPFERLAEGIDTVSQRTDNIMPLMDGMEIYNARAPYKYSSANRLAQEKAYHSGITVLTSGSDAHIPSEIGNAYCIVDTPSRSLEDIKKAVLDGKVEFVPNRHAKRTCIVKSEFIKARKFKRSVFYKAKLILKYPLFFTLDMYDKIIGRKL